MPSIFAVARDFLKKQREHIANVKYVVSLLKAPMDNITEQYANSILSEVPIDGNTSFKTVKAEVESLVADLLQEIPVCIKDHDFVSDTLSSQLRVMAQKLFLSDSALANVAGLLANARDNLVGNVDTLSAEVQSLADDAKGYIDDFKQLTESVDPRLIQQMAKEALPLMTSYLEEARQKTVALHDRIKDKKDFSKARVDSLLSSLTGFATSMPDMSTISSMFSPINTDMVGRADEAQTALQAVIGQTTNLANFKDNILQKILPGDIFDSNFSKLYSTYKSISADINSLTGELKNGLGSRSMQSMCSSIGKIQSIAGQIKLLGNKQFKTDLSDESNNIVQRMKGFAKQLSAHVFPTEALAGMRMDIRSVASLADRFVGNKLPMTPSVLNNMLSTVRDRIDGAAAAIKTNLETFKTVANLFEAAPTADVVAFFNSVGTIAPTAMDALLQGDINRFQNTLMDPKKINAAGEAIAEINDYINANRATLTTDTANLLGIMNSYLGGQVKMFEQHAWTSNQAGQRARALKSLDQSVMQFILPIEKVLQLLESRINV